MNERIVIDSKICHGKPVISETRMPVAVVVGSLARLATAAMGPSRPWSDGYLFSALNLPRLPSTPPMLAMLKRAQTSSPVTSGPPLKGGRRVASGGSRLGIKRSVRVQTFTGSGSLGRQHVKRRS
jgi:hypothetical protein